MTKIQNEIISICRYLTFDPNIVVHTEILTDRSVYII